KHNYPFSKEEDKSDKTEMQSNNKETSDLCQKISIDNRETVVNSQCSISDKIEITRINKIKELSNKKKRLKHISEIGNKGIRTTEVVGNPHTEVK
ncbi:10961_t:CDS:1, partial [Cetraspora pellucida]